MKKAYLDPEFEFVNVRLVANIVGDSSEVEETLPETGEKPSEGGFDDEDW